MFVLWMENSYALMSSASSFKGSVSARRCSWLTEGIFTPHSCLEGSWHPSGPLHSWHWDPQVVTAQQGPHSGPVCSLIRGWGFCWFQPSQYSKPAVPSWISFPSLVLQVPFDPQHPVSPAYSSSKRTTSSSLCLPRKHHVPSQLPLTLDSGFPSSEESTCVESRFFYHTLSLGTAPMLPACTGSGCSSLSSRADLWLVVCPLPWENKAMGLRVTHSLAQLLPLPLQNSKDWITRVFNLLRPFKEFWG